MRDPSLSDVVPASRVMSPQPTVLRADDRISAALREMELSAIHHLPVVDTEGRLAGLVTHRDLVAAAARGRERVEDVMVRDVKTVSPETPAHEAAYLLLRHAIGCVPVTDAAARPVGILTVTDFVRVAYSLLGGRVPVDELEMEEEEARRV
jgi:CBS domain-containing protein